MGRLIVFAPFLLLLLLIIIIIISANILSGQVLSNHWTDCLIIWGYDRYGYDVVQEDFKIQNSPILYGTVNILHKSIAGRYRPVRVADGPITARCRFMENASWDDSDLLYKTNGI